MTERTEGFWWVRHEGKEAVVEVTPWTDDDQAVWFAGCDSHVLASSDSIGWIRYEGKSPMFRTDDIAREFQRLRSDEPGGSPGSTEGDTPG